MRVQRRRLKLDLNSQKNLCRGWCTSGISFVIFVICNCGGYGEKECKKRLNETDNLVLMSETKEGLKKTVSKIEKCIGVQVTEGES